MPLGIAATEAGPAGFPPAPYLNHQHHAHTDDDEQGRHTARWMCRSEPERRGEAVPPDMEPELEKKTSATSSACWRHVARAIKDAAHHHL